MRNVTTRQILVAIFISIIFLIGYAPALSSFFQSLSSETIETDVPEPTLTLPPPTASPTLTPTAEPPTPTSTMTQTPTPRMIYYEPGLVEAPILLYHHVQGDYSINRYEVSIPDFEAQMVTLKEMGYNVVTLSQLLQALIDGGELPENPVVITFDDGHESIYYHAFPIMKELGLPGVFYIVANRIYGSPEFLGIDQLKEMIAAGWEIGSHGYSHLDMTINHDLADWEISQSKLDLQEALSTNVQTFAYPFGAIDAFTAQTVSDSGYMAGMGLGISKVHTWNTLFYLNRIEIYGDYSLEDFVNILSGE
jgi:peptidoglycan/xylan/chitin deacetylase (PgdA/CDA1 family)